MDREIQDQKIIDEFFKGNEVAFSWLVKKYLKMVLNFLYQLVGNISVAEDLAQETFVKAWKNFERFDSTQSLKTWLFIIAKNTAYDYCKKKKELPFSLFTDEEGNNQLENINENSPLPDELLEKKDLAKELEQKLDQLKAHYRIILLMHYQQDLSLQEIAQILAKPYNTIKSQHQRALAALRKILES